MQEQTDPLCPQRKDRRNWCCRWYLNRNSIDVVDIWWWWWFRSWWWYLRFEGQPLMVSCKGDVITGAPGVQSRTRPHHRICCWNKHSTNDAHSSYVLADLWCQKDQNLRRSLSRHHCHHRTHRSDHPIAQRAAPPREGSLLYTAWSFS